ncbi:DoxX family protein [Nocardia sp. IFM 10818]
MTTTSAPNSPLSTNHTTSVHAYDAGLLAIRLGIGLTMAAHGAQKLFSWFDGYGITGTGQGFEQSGYPVGEFMAVLAGLSEFVGGLGVALGALTPLSAAALVGVMINALAVKWGAGWLGSQSGPGLEYEIVLLVTAGGLALTGPGRYSVDAFLPGLRSHRLTYGVAALALAVVLAFILLFLRD